MEKFLLGVWIVGELDGEVFGCLDSCTNRSTVVTTWFSSNILKAVYVIILFPNTIHCNLVLPQDPPHLGILPNLFVNLRKENYCALMRATRHLALN